MSNIDKQAVQAVADLKAGYTIGNADVAILNELARIALASLEAEAVAWLLSGGGAKNHVSFDSGNAYADPLREVTPLYTAPPAPVALTSGYSDFEEIWSSSTHPLTQDDEMKDFAWDIWNACRAAMLKHSEPFIVTSDHRMMEMPQVEAINAVTAMLQGAENAESRCTIKTAPALDSLTKNAESRCGNSPVIPEGWVLVPEEPTHEMLEAGDEQFGTYDVYRRMIAAAPQQEVK